MLQLGEQPLGSPRPTRIVGPIVLPKESQRLPWITPLVRRVEPPDPSRRAYDRVRGVGAAGLNAAFQVLDDEPPDAPRLVSGDAVAGRARRLQGGQPVPIDARLRGKTPPHVLHATAPAQSAIDEHAQSA